MKKQTKLKKILMPLILLTIFLSSCNSEQTQAPKDVSSSSNILEIKLVDDKIKLLENDKTIKIYEINPLVLPPEDILLLSEGINVKDESEADSIAENFDG